MAEMILFSNGERMGMIREGETFPLPSQRYQRYREAMQEIRRQHQWKNSGTGALFMGNLSGLAEDQEPAVRIGGTASSTTPPFWGAWGGCTPRIP